MRIWLCVAFALAVALAVALVVTLVDSRELRRKAATHDAACRHVKSYLTVQAQVLRAADPRESGLRSRIAQEAANYTPIRWCIEFPDDAWNSCVDDVCRASVLEEAATRVAL